MRVSHIQTPSNSVESAVYKIAVHVKRNTDPSEFRSSRHCDNAYMTGCAVAHVFCCKERCPVQLMLVEKGIKIEIAVSLFRTMFRLTKLPAKKLDVCPENEFVQYCNCMSGTISATSFIAVFIHILNLSFEESDAEKNLTTFYNGYVSTIQNIRNLKVSTVKIPERIFGEQEHRIIQSVFNQN